MSSQSTSGACNVFVKNLDKDVDEELLYDTFWTFGNILSCKIAADERGPKGYGYILFETEAAGIRAIENANGMLLYDKKVYVTEYIPRRERMAMMGDKAKKYNNVYIKNFGEEYDDDKLKDTMEKFGKVISAKVMTDAANKSRGFGFICFEDPETAEKCVDNIMGIELNGKTLYASGAQKRAERQAELKEKFDRLKLERSTRYQGVNLYVKNLDDCIDDDRLRKEFSQFGIITSAKVMGDGTRSKGFGFVCFSSPEDAQKAMTEMHGRIIVSKPLYVALSQRKEDRRAHLASQHMQRITTMRQQQNTPFSQVSQPGGAGYFVPTMPQTPRGYYTQTQMPQFQASPRWQTPVRQPQPGEAFYQPVPVNQMQQTQFPSACLAMNQPIDPSGAAAAMGGTQFHSQMGNPQTPQQQIMTQPAASVEIADQEPLTASMLAAAPPQEQKQMLCERLFPVINRMYQELTGNIINILLQNDNSELLHMLESQESLNFKVEEAVAVLQDHQAKENAETREPE